MDSEKHSQIVNFIWGIADDVLRNVYKRSDYRDVILPMTVLRRLDTLLEDKVEETREAFEDLKERGVEEKEGRLKAVAGRDFYNTSGLSMKTIISGDTSEKKAYENLKVYLDGFSENVQEIIDRFKFRNELDKLREHKVLTDLIEKFVSNEIHLGPEPVVDEDGTVLHEGLSNHGMGTVFEELIRRFNEENNEEAGEHFTPRDVIRLMANLVFRPIAGNLGKASYLLYDPACGSGGMLTESERLILEGDEKAEIDALAPDARLHLYGQEVNDETYAICRSDMMIKGRDAENIAFGSTLANDGFPDLEFDFMFSNPPYGKKWKTDRKEILDDDGNLLDPRFEVVLEGPFGEEETVELLPRVNDAQLLFLVTMLQKMKGPESPIGGSRVATVHNGSALFTGDAGQGESDTRRWILENDWLEAIVAFPEGMFYNTGISTYVWILSNQKPDHREGKVQLIDARDLCKDMRDNKGQKNKTVTRDHVETITEEFLRFEETDRSQIFENEEFGYYNIVVERPERRAVQISDERLTAFHDEHPDLAETLGDKLREWFGTEVHYDYNRFRRVFKQKLDDADIKTYKKDRQAVYDTFSWIDEDAEPVIKRVKEKTLFDGETEEVIEHEPDTDLRDRDERVPMVKDEDARTTIERYFENEVKPYVPDAFIDWDDVRVGYEINFTRYFYEYEPPRDLDEIAADIRDLEAETDGLLTDIVEA